MRAVAEAIKGLLEDAKPRTRGHKDEHRYLVRTTKEAMADKEKEAVAHTQLEQRS
jgi:hypothetical protein